MRNTPNLRAETFRVHTPQSSACKGTNAGQFQIGHLCVISSDGGGWDHVSVHVGGRCPTWDEMCFVKELFFRDDEVVMQLHPVKKDYVNCHPYALHLWRPQSPEKRREIKGLFGYDEGLPDIDYPPIPLPPKEMV